jgi:hypothetical protein
MLYVILPLRFIVNEIIKQIYAHGVSCHYSRAVRPILINFFLDDHIFPIDLVLRCLQDTIRITFTNRKRKR